MSAKNDVITVGFPLYDDCTLVDFAGATQVFTPFSGAGFKPVWLARDLQPVRTTEEVSVMPNFSFAEAPELDILFLPGGGGGVARAMLDDAYLEDLRRLAEPAQWVGSVCTGAFILAAAGGILDGHRVTTYWSQLDNLALFPELTVDTTSYPRALIDGRRFTGGGISSSLDLALRLVDDIKGKEVCETVQLAIQYNPEPPYDSGDPSTAPAAIVAAQRRAQQGFIELIRQTTEEVLSRRP